MKKHGIKRSVRFGETGLYSSSAGWRNDKKRASGSDGTQTKYYGKDPGDADEGRSDRGESRSERKFTGQETISV